MPMRNPARPATAEPVRSYARSVAVAALDTACEEVSAALDLAIEQRGIGRAHIRAIPSDTDALELEAGDDVVTLQRVWTAVRGARALIPEASVEPMARPVSPPSLVRGAKVGQRSHNFDALEEERQRLLREIHDGPAQVISNIGLRLDYLSKVLNRDPERVQMELGYLQDDVRRAVLEMRRFMYELVPPGLPQGDLRAAIEGHCDRIAARFGMAVWVAFDADPPLTRGQQTAIFRIVQESLQNVIKHAGAGNVWVSSAIEGEALVVTIRDDGMGLDNLEDRLLTGQHLGISGMRARIRQVGGTIQIGNGACGGTVVLVRLPLDA